jgi:hypothetical protein
MLARLVCLIVVVGMVASACRSSPPQTRTGRTVISQYNGWTIGVSPSISQSHVWRARVQVWPKDVNPQSHGGIALPFRQSAQSESAIVGSAAAFAREYIDASTARGNADPDRSSAAQQQQGRTVVSEYNGWTIRITPSTNASDRGAWRAAVVVWPPGRNPENLGGIQIQFTEMAADERRIVDSAAGFARRYIDSSTTRHQ